MQLTPLQRDCQTAGLAMPPAQPRGVTRRAVLLGMLGAAPVLTHAAQRTDAGLTPDPDFWRRPRTLWLSRPESGEQVRAQFWAEGRYLPEGYAQLCWLMRDLREKQGVQMDTTLLNVLAGLLGYYVAYGLKGPLILTSGFRTFTTNQRLAGEGAARNSMHLYGRAADISIPGVPVDHLGRVKQYLHAGGLGFYPSRNFVHLDTGNARTWRG